MAIYRTNKLLIPAQLTYMISLRSDNGV